MSTIHISISQQTLTLFKYHTALHTYPISSSINGTGNQENSGCTPLGAHRIKLKIGEDCPINSVFVGRRATGEIYTPALAKNHPERDWILSRILWLQGSELDLNRGKNIDSLKRYIYIHGTPDTEPMGIPKSCGCIRMRNHDIIELFTQVQNGTTVSIIP